MKNISPANNPFVKTPSTKPAISRNKKVICSQKSVVNNKLQTQRKEEALRRRWKELPEAVFVNTKGKMLNERNLRERHHYPACSKAKLRRNRIHDIRHSYATIRIDAGHNIADISKQLGHSSIKVTVDTYYKWIAGSHSDQTAELDRLGIPAPACTPAAPEKIKGLADTR
jgi:integrase